MYNFNLLENEEIVLISDNSILKMDEKDVNISTVLTNMRLVFLDYPSNTNNYEEVLRTSRGVDYIKKKEEFYSVRLEEIKDIVKNDDFDKYILENGNYFLLKDEAINKKIEK